LGLVFGIACIGAGLELSISNVCLKSSNGISLSPFA
jgi:hypothetical protein